MNSHRNFATLLVVVGLAFFVPLILSRFRRLRLPIVVGKILAGILIVRSGFNLVQPNAEVLGLFAQFGFVFLFFLAGTEIGFSMLSLQSGGKGLQKLREKSKAQTLISTFNDVNISLRVCEIARYTYQIPLVIAQVNQPAELLRGLLILAIRRNDELMVPDSDTRLVWDDHLTLIGAAEDVVTARHFFGQSNCD